MAAVAQDQSVYQRVDQELGRLFNLPLTEHRAILEAAQVVGIDAGKYAAGQLDQLRNDIFQRGVGTIQQALAGKDPASLTRRDLNLLERANNFADRLMVINNLAAPDLGATAHPVSVRFQFSFSPHTNAVNFKLPDGLNYAEASKLVFDALHSEPGCDRSPIESWLARHPNYESPPIRKFEVFHSLPDLGGLTRKDQEQGIKGFGGLHDAKLVSPYQLAIAVALVELETGEDLLNGKLVRTTEPGIAFYRDGTRGNRLGYTDVPDKAREENVTAWALSNRY